MINKFATVAWKEQKALKIFDGKGTGARNSQTSLKYRYHRWVEQHSSFQEIGYEQPTTTTAANKAYMCCSFTYFVCCAFVLVTLYHDLCTV